MQYVNDCQLSESQLFDILEASFDQGKKTNTDTIDKLYCSCGNNENIFTDHVNGIMVCKKCGQFMNGVLDQNPEWLNYNNKPSVVRCNIYTNPHLPKSSLGTSISSKFNIKIKKLNEWESMPYEERSLNNIFKIIKNKCSKANIKKCIEDDAKIMYKYISNCTFQYGENKGKKIIIRARNRVSIIASCVYFACIRKGEPRSPHEIAELFEIDYTRITNGFKKFAELMRLMKLNKSNNIKFVITASMPEDFIPRFCKKINLSNDLIEKTIKLTTNIGKLNVASGHTQTSIAIGSLWLIIEKHDIQITKKQMANKFKISEVTIGKIYNIIKPYYKILMDDIKVNNILNVTKQYRKRISIPSNLEENYWNNIYSLQDDPSNYINSIRISDEYFMIHINKKYQMIVNKMNQLLNKD